MSIRSHAGNFGIDGYESVGERGCRQVRNACSGFVCIRTWLDRQLEELLIENDEPAETIRFVSHTKTEKPVASRELSLGVMPLPTAVAQNSVESSNSEGTSWLSLSVNGDNPKPARCT